MSTPPHLPAAPDLLLAEEEARRNKAFVSGAKRLRMMVARAARDDPDTFMSFVLRDEKTNKQLKQAPIHKEWQATLNKSPRVIFWSHVEAGKTSQIAIGRTLWELGRDPTLRVCLVSNTSDMARKIVRLLGQYIEKSVELHMVFPHLVPTDDPQLPWKAQALTVKRVGVGSKDPSVQACGMHGNILGSRVDLLIMDDVLDHENTNTPAPREDAYRWIRSTPFSRLTENARVWFIGNAWHPDDAMHRLAKEPRFLGKRYPVIDDRGRLTWPERWSRSRIKSAKDDLGPLEYAQQLMCQARDDTSARFKRDWIDNCLKMGDGLRTVETLEEAWAQDGRPMPPGVEPPERPEDSPDFLARGHEEVWRAGGSAFVFCGVDLGIQRKDAADLTSLFVMLVEPDGKRRPLCIESGRWTGPDILKRIENLYLRFGAIFIVENNAAQHYIVQWARESQLTIPVVPFTTGRNKAHPEFGVESIGAEMAGSRWRIPNEGGKLDDEIGEWIQELLFYDPREHVGDRVMASWFAREGARRFADFSRSGHAGSRVRTIG